MDEMKQLETLGIGIPSMAYIMGVMVFSIIGYAGYRYGKKAELNNPRFIGIALMLYPYVVTDTVWMYVVGCGLCVALYLYRE